MSEFIFNGISSADMGFVLKQSPVVELPIKKIEKVSIGNRNGDLIVDNGAYEKITITFECYLLKDFTPKNLREIKKLFLNRQGKLILGDNKSKYYNAYLSNTIDITKIVHQLSECVLTFECDPFLKDVEQDYINIPSTGTGPEIPQENINLFGANSGAYKTEAEAKAFWYADDFVAAYDAIKKHYVLVADGTKAYSLGFMCNSFINGKITKGKTYTLSMDIKATEAKEYQCSFYKGDASDPLHWNVNLQVPKANEWVRVSYTFEALETSSSQNFYIYPTFGPTISIANIKVEDGAKDTGWNNGTIVVPPTESIGSIEYENDGDVECYPTFVINSANKKNIELVVNKEKIVFSDIKGSLIVDSSNYIVTLDGVNYSHKMIGNFPCFNTGKNSISFKAADSVKFKPNKEYV